MSKLVILIFPLIAFLFGIENLNIDSLRISTIDNDSSYVEHISLLLNERMINDFLQGILPIRDTGKALLLTYNWSLINPHIDIEKDTALFFSDIEISVGPVKTIKKIEGHVSIKFDQDINKIILKIEEAKVIIDINILGKNIVLTELDIASYFSNPFKLNGPEPISSNIEYKLPNGEIRKLSVHTVKSELTLAKDAIEVSTTLQFNKIVD